MSTASDAIPLDEQAARKLAGREAAKLDYDVQLMLQFKSGNRGAFEGLIRRNHSKVFSIIWRFVGDQAEAEDLTQEVFLRVLRTAHRYVPTAKFSTWLYRIAANVSLNAIRARSRVRQTSLELPDEGGEAGFQRALTEDRSPPPGAGLDRRELRRAVLQAVAQLPETQRMAIILNKYEELSYEEIAGLLGCSIMAVKSLLSRARCNLKCKLAGYVERGDPPPTS